MILVYLKCLSQDTKQTISLIQSQIGNSRYMKNPFRSIKMNVLHIQSSPRGDKSNSIALTNAFFSASRKVLPVINEDVLNVWDENLPEFDAASIGAK
jgi:Flavodoxin-like fold